LDQLTGRALLPAALDTASGSERDNLWATATTRTSLPAVPAAPTNLVVESTRQSSITLAWRDNSINEDGFYIERSTDGKTWARIASLGANTTSFVDSNLARRRTYWYKVQAFNIAGTSDYSNIVSVKMMYGGCR